MKILVVEDDAVSARIVIKRAETLGHECDVVHDGDEAWRRISTDETIDVVISGWFHPGLSGRDLCKRIREHTPRYVPFIFITAADDHPVQIEGMQAGADDYLLKPLDMHHLRLRLIAAERLTDVHRKIAVQASELRRLNTKLYAQGRRDEMTGIANRRRLTEDAEKLMRAAVRLGLGYSLAMVDVDHFKAYNDAYGHVRGDEALIAIAKSLTESSRGEDMVYRYGGEEFVVILQTDEPDTAVRITERVRRAVERLAMPHPTMACLTVSAGVTSMSAHQPLTMEEVVQRADAALYTAKKEGRNKVVLWKPGMVSPERVKMRMPGPDPADAEFFSPPSRAAASDDDGPEVEIDMLDDPLTEA